MTQKDVSAIPEIAEDKNPSYTIARCDSVVSVRAMARARSTLELISTTPGDRRAQFERDLASFDDDRPAVTVRYGTASVSVTKTGGVVYDEKTGRYASHPAGLHPVLDTSVPGSAPGNKIVGNMMIPCGVCLIIAGGGTGKTPLAHTLAAAGVDSYTAVRVGEPLAGYSSSNESVAYSLAYSMLRSSNIVLDSIKDLLSGGGSAMKSGLSRDALVSISALAATACSAGCTVYIPVNPSTPDPEVLELLAEISRSNATMTIVTVGAKSWEYSARKGESLKRTSGVLSFTYDQDGLGVVKTSVNPIESSNSEEITRKIATIVSGPAMNSAFRRATENH